MEISLLPNYETHHLQVKFPAPNSLWAEEDNPPHQKSQTLQAKLMLQPFNRMKAQEAMMSWLEGRRALQQSPPWLSKRSLCLLPQGVRDRLFGQHQQEGHSTCSSHPNHASSSAADSETCVDPTRARGSSLPQHGSHSCRECCVLILWRG